MSHRSWAPCDGKATLTSTARLGAEGGSCYQRDHGVIQVDVGVEFQVCGRVGELLGASQDAIGSHQRSDRHVR
eukprot:6821330-Heterocapsa_arctica.AAC.1